MAKLFKRPVVTRILHAVGPYIVRLYLQMVGRTQGLRVEGRNYLPEVRRGGGPFLFAFWHNRLLFPAYLYRGTQTGVLVSPSRDGEYIALTMKLFGMVPLRGSSAKDPALGLLKLVRHLRDGFCVAVTPDGPRGPREHVQMGVVELSKLSTVPVIPCAYAPSRRITLNSWDRFVIPLPFTTGAVVYREPISVPENASKEQMEEIRRQLEMEIRIATEQAEELAKGRGM